MAKMSKNVAKDLASELDNKQAGQYAKVGSFVTNGKENYVVHVTFDDSRNPRPYAYTIS